MAQLDTQQVLAICSYSPGEQVKAREALDAILATAVFDQAISIVFCGDGVWQLLAAQGDYSGSNKALSCSLDALPLYDVHAVYADALSLQERGLEQQQLLPQVEIISSDRARELLANSHRVMSF